MLLDKGANPNVKNKLGGTPLMWAAVYGNDDAVRLLLNRGADASLKDNDGITALDWAVSEQARQRGRGFAKASADAAGDRQLRLVHLQPRPVSRRAGRDRLKCVATIASRLSEIESELRPERIVISPGPGTPDTAGISLEVIERFAGKIPLLGVCLGPPGDRAGVWRARDPRAGVDAWQGVGGYSRRARRYLRD